MELGTQLRPTQLAPWITILIVDCTLPSGIVWMIDVFSCCCNPCCRQSCKPKLAKFNRWWLDNAFIESYLLLLLIFASVAVLIWGPQVFVAEKLAIWQRVLLYINYAFLIVLMVWYLIHVWAFWKLKKLIKARVDLLGIALLSEDDISPFEYYDDPQAIADDYKRRFRNEDEPVVKRETTALLADVWRISDTEAECSICLSSLYATRVIESPCHLNHVFHLECLAIWLESHA